MMDVAPATIRSFFSGEIINGRAGKKRKAKVRYIELLPTRRRVWRSGPGE